MKYITDSDGQVKVTDDKGNIKWLPKHIAENKRRMNSLGLTIMEAPVLLEPLILEETNTNESEVAEIAPAKRGRKPNQ